MECWILFRFDFIWHHQNKCSYPKRKVYTKVAKHCSPKAVLPNGLAGGHPFLNTLRPRQHDRHFADDTFKRIFFNENVWISIKISLKFVPNGPINNILALVQIMAWRRSGDKPLSEPMMVSLPTHICATRPQWVNFVTNVLLFTWN